MIEEYSTIMPLYINTQMIKEKKAPKQPKKPHPNKKKTLKKPPKQNLHVFQN